MTNQQAQEVAALAVARARRELAEHEASGAYRSARLPRVGSVKRWQVPLLLASSGTKLSPW